MPSEWMSWIVVRNLFEFRALAAQPGCGMKILVTGASGYAGRQLAEELSQSGHEVTCMVRKHSTASLSSGTYARIVEADALRPETLPEALLSAPSRLIQVKAKPANLLWLIQL